MLWIVAGSGPSLESVCSDNVIAVNDAYRLCPNARILYAADVAWWEKHEGCPAFKGEKWTCTSSSQEYGIRQGLAKRFGIKIIAGRKGHGFSLDPSYVHYGGNGGFQAVNLALHRGANPVVLVGFDMRGEHFFGKHEQPLRQTRPHAFDGWCKQFAKAAEMLPKNIRIFNATPDSALTCFPMMTLEEALRAH
jgi:hypothetical protein